MDESNHNSSPGLTGGNEDKHKSRRRRRGKKTSRGDDGREQVSTDVASHQSARSGVPGAAGPPGPSGSSGPSGTSAALGSRGLSASRGSGSKGPDGGAAERTKRTDAAERPGASAHSQSQQVALRTPREGEVGEGAKLSKSRPRRRSRNKLASGGETPAKTALPARRSLLPLAADSPDAAATETTKRKSHKSRRTKRSDDTAPGTGAVIGSVGSMGAAGAVGTAVASGRVEHGSVELNLRWSVAPAAGFQDADEAKATSARVIPASSRVPGRRGRQSVAPSAHSALAGQPAPWVPSALAAPSDQVHARKQVAKQSSASPAPVRRWSSASPNLETADPELRALDPTPWFLYLPPTSLDGSLYNAVAVRVHRTAHVRYFDAGDAVYEQGTNVAVEPDSSGDTTGVVVKSNERMILRNRVPRVLHRLTMLPTLREPRSLNHGMHGALPAPSAPPTPTAPGTASTSGAATAAQPKREQYLLRIARQAVNALNLPVKIVSARVDTSNRATVFFSCEERVDLRNLYRRVTSASQMRIELRQVGVRDTAKMLGGMAPCGLQLCCRSFLKDFAPVSVKMAKDQGLVLNPQRVSGVCGRLLCCLTYEDNYYRTQRKLLPKIGKRVITAQGPARVRDVDVLAQTVKVLLETGEMLVLKPSEFTPMFPSPKAPEAVDAAKSSGPSESSGVSGATESCGRQDAQTAKEPRRRQLSTQPHVPADAARPDERKPARRRRSKREPLSASSGRPIIASSASRRAATSSKPDPTSS